MLLRGTLPAGKRIEEVDLGQRLAVSRPVLRSILAQLASEGLLDTVPSGAYVARHFTLDDVRDAILARSTLEGLAASLAASRFRDPSDLETARRLNAELGGAITLSAPGPPAPEEMSRFGDLNAAFHRALVDLARSPMLSWYIQRTQAVAFASPGAVVLPEDGTYARRAFEEHESILNAIQARDSVRADALVKEHARLAIYAIESALAGQPHSGRNIAVALIGKPLPKPTARKKTPAPGNGGSLNGPTSERILDVTAELFREKGFYAATTRELANRLNVQQASLYYYIKKKEDLLHRLCGQVMDSFLADLPAALQNQEHGRNRIRAFIGAHLNAMLRHPNRTLAMVTEFKALSRPHFTEITQKYREYANLLDSELEFARAAGDLRADVPSKYLRLALLNVLNWTPRWFHPTGALSTAELSSIYERVFFEGAGCGESISIFSLPRSTSRRRMRDVHHGTLGKFIRGAAELFARYGYESTTTRNLASLLGMEKATLYYHVEGKEDLLYAICKSSIEQLADDVNAAIAGLRDPLEQIQALIQAHVVNLLRHQTEHATALAEARALSSDRLAEIVGMRKAYQTRIRSLLEAGQKSGRVRTDIPSKYLGLMLEGLLDRSVVWYRRNGELSPPELGLTFCKLFITGARARS